MVLLCKVVHFIIYVSLFFCYIALFARFAVDARRLELFQTIQNLPPLRV